MKIETWRRLGFIFMWANISMAVLNLVLILATMVLNIVQPLFYLNTIICIIGAYAAYTIKERCDELLKDDIESI